MGNGGSIGDEGGWEQQGPSGRILERMAGNDHGTPDVAPGFVKVERREDGVAILAVGDRKGAALALRAVGSLVVAVAMVGGLHFLPFISFSVWLLIPLGLVLLWVLWVLVIESMNLSQIYAKPVEVLVTSEAIQIRYGRSRLPRYQLSVDDVRGVQLVKPRGEAAKSEASRYVMIEIGRRDSVTIAHRERGIAKEFAIAVRDAISSMKATGLPDLLESDLQSLKDKLIRRPRGTRIRRIRRDGEWQLFVPAHMSLVRLILEWVLTGLLVATGIGLLAIAIWAILQSEPMIAIAIAPLGLIIIGSGAALAVSTWRWRKSELTITVHDGMLAIDDTSPVLNKGRVISIDDIISISAIGTLDADDKAMQRALLLMHFDRERIRKVKLMQLYSDQEVEWVASELRRATGALVSPT
ncbi:MAG: hypothetical protein EA376_12780 [Phycisphaeraceae bacterium]|nr:MAG: hypothetical protein EA376_12780 [Phycisphaeraceae bacterium]